MLSERTDPYAWIDTGFMYMFNRNAFMPLLKGDDKAWAKLPVPRLQSELDKFTEQLMSFKTPYLEEAGYTVEFGPPKLLSRVEEKRNGEKRPKVMPDFKAFSDLARMQIPVSDVGERFRVVSLLITDVSAACPSPFTYFYIERNVYAPNTPDIVQRVNFFAPGICDVPVEVWIGHPFALEVFAQNSRVRNMMFSSDKKEYFDWFGDSGAYNQVKKAILEGDPAWKQIARDCVPEGHIHLVSCIMD
jgi:hypothetical protein